MAFLDNIKRYFAKKEIVKSVQKNKRKASFPDFNEVKSIMLLFRSDADEQNVKVHQYADKLKQEGKKVFLWGIIDKKNIDTLQRTEYRLIGDKDLNEFSLPNKDLVEEFRNNDYDMMIALYCGEELALDYLLSQGRADFKISAYRDYGEIADLMIAINDDSDEEYLLNQLLFYIRNVQSKD